MSDETGSPTVAWHLPSFWCQHPWFLQRQQPLRQDSRFMLMRSAMKRVFVLCQASEHDAVTRNFGDGLAPGSSPLTTPRRLISLSSAYMLVYIRESYVTDVMNPIPVEEIPRALTQRLHDEEKRKRREEVLRLEEKRYGNIPYATEQHVKEFKDYSGLLDFVSLTVRAAVHGQSITCLLFDCLLHIW